MESTTKAVKDLTILSTQPSNANRAAVRVAPSKVVTNIAAPAVLMPDLHMPQASDPTSFSGNINVMNIDQRQSFAGKEALYELTARPGFGDANGSFDVYTNHLKMALNSPKDGRLFIYEVSPIADDLTKPKKRVLMESFIHKCALLYHQKQHFVTDYKKRIVSWIDLSSTSKDGPPMADGLLAQVDVDDHDPRNPNSGSTTLTMKLKFSKALDYQDLVNFCTGSDNTAKDSDLMSAINLIFARQAEKPETFAVGANKVFVKRGQVDLKKDNKVAIRGYRFGFSTGMGSPLLNVNPTMSAFHKPMRVSEYIKGGFYLREHLQGCRVWLSLDRLKDWPAHLPAGLDEPGRRIKTIKGFGQLARQQPAYDDFTVWDHYKYYYNERTAGKAGSVCVNLGGDAPNQQWFLAEDLVILPYQIYRDTSGALNSAMVSHACRAPQDNRDLIVSEFLPMLGMNNQTSTHLDMSKVQGPHLFSQLVTVPAHNTPQPQVRYSNNTTKLSYGQWDLVQQKFLTTSAKFAGKAFFLLPKSLKLSKQETSQYLWFFHEQYHHNGVTGLTAFSSLNASNHAEIEEFDTESLEKAFTKAVENKADLVVLILPSKNKQQLANYAAFKTMADQNLGMKSLCMCEEKIMAPFSPGRGANKTWNGLPQSVQQDHPFSNYVRNIGMKLNVRLGNKNHSVQMKSLEDAIPGYEKDKSVMILGADVVHPGTKSVGGTPSIAAVVGSMAQGFG